jgi:RNA polymerase sigma-70 factor (ECF subfamily)
MSPHTEFTERLAAHAGVLHQIARAYAWTAEDRADLLQEMRLQLWRAFPRWQRDLPFSTFMYRVALNVAISQLRSATASQRDVHATELMGDDDMPDAGNSHDDVERMQTLWALLQRLPEIDRALMLMALDGQDAPLIAEALGLSVSNVGTRLQRLKARLAEAYRKEST